jgi:hypothetical protein
MGLLLGRQLLLMGLLLGCLLSLQLSQLGLQY